jgi:hypothetical protein
MGREKEWGFYESRARGRRREYGRRWYWVLAFIGLLLLAGLTRSWPQSSGLSLSGSGSDLRTWETLSREFRSGLDEQSTRLRQALTELETSKADLLKLTSLLEQSLRANDLLREYNAQMAERMRERDEDLAGAYEDINRLEKRELRLIIAVVILGAALAAIAVIKLFIL